MHRGKLVRLCSCLEEGCRVLSAPRAERACVAGVCLPRSCRMCAGICREIGRLLVRLADGPGKAECAPNLRQSCRSLCTWSHRGVRFARGPRGAWAPCRRIPELEAAVARLDAENAQLTESTARSAAVAGELLAEQQQRWEVERQQAGLVVRSPAVAAPPASAAPHQSRSAA